MIGNCETARGENLYCSPLSFSYSSFQLQLFTRDAGYPWQSCVVTSSALSKRMVSTDRRGGTIDREKLTMRDCVGTERLTFYAELSRTKGFSGMGSFFYFSKNYFSVSFRQNICL